jgi:hypothetical protein
MCPVLGFTSSRTANSILTSSLSLTPAFPGSLIPKSIFAPVGVFTRLSKSEQRTVTGKAKTHHMLDAKKVWLFGRLKHSLQLLASQAEIQFRELPTFCNKSDELFLSYSNWRMALIGNFQSEITAQQLSCLEAIQQQFGRMGRESWTDSAVNNSAEWKQIRQLSRAALEAFRWSQ